MIDPGTAANVAVEAVGICVKAVKLIKRAVETMRQVREGLLELVNRTERMKTLMDLVRILCTELKGTTQEGQDVIPLNSDKCIRALRDLETLANYIAVVWAKNKAFAGVQWLWYENKARELVKKLHEQEVDIVNLLVIIGTISNVKTSKEVHELKEAAAENFTVVDAFDGLTLVGETLQTTRSDPDNLESPPTWLGHVVFVNEDQSPIMSEHYISHRHELSEAVYWGNWPALWAELQVGRDEYSESWINATRLKPLSSEVLSSFWTPLHQAVYNRASLEVVEKMVYFGALRSLRTRWTRFSDTDMTPLELAQDLGYSELYSALAPIIRWPVPASILSVLQERFHAIVCENLGHRIDSEHIYLPELVGLTEMANPQMWFPVKGTNCSPAGYVYRLDGRELVVKSYNMDPTDMTGRSRTYRLTVEEAYEVDEALIFGN